MIDLKTDKQLAVVSDVKSMLDDKVKATDNVKEDGFEIV